MVSLQCVCANSNSPQGLLCLGGRSGQIFEIFEILGGAGDVNNSIRMANYCNGPYILLLLCATKVFSAWAEVRTGTCPSSKRFWFPEVRDLNRFSRFLSFWAGLVI